jgi:hypothetical protein
MEPRYRYDTPEGEQTITRSEVLARYMDHFAARLRRMGREAEITEAACVDDFIVTHWAWQIDEAGELVKFSDFEE